MKNTRTKKTFSIVFLCAIIITVGLLINNKLNTRKIDKIINISNLSESFMDKYFKETKSLKEEDKENILIVTSLKEVNDTYGATKIIEAPNHQYMLQYDSKEDKDSALKELKQDRTIENVEENGYYTIDSTSSYNSWGVEKMALDHAIDEADITRLENVTVAVIDTGCNVELVNKYYNGKIVEFYNVLDDSTTNMSDADGHGTHVSGTVAEATPANVKVMPVKVTDTNEMSYTDIIAAINYITYYEKADVLNMSFGGYGKSTSLETAIEAARQKNIITVAAAGNDNTKNDHYPSAFTNTISIASVDSSLKKSNFSNYGTTITFTAPGTNIKSLMDKNTSIAQQNGNSDDDDHETISGTSMATPHAASAVAILKGYNKDLTLEDTIEVLKKTSIDLGDQGWDQYYGYGLISFKDAEFCDGTHCDEYNIYKDLNKNVHNIEVTELKLTDYNYYSLTNLMGTKVRITNTDSTVEELNLWEVPDLEILNYDPTSTTTQTVTIKSDDISTTINVTNPVNYESGWIYTINNYQQIEITGYKNNNLEIGKLYVPETIESLPVVSFKDNTKFNEFTDFNAYNYLYLPSNFQRIGDYTLANTNIKYIVGNIDGIDIGAHALESSNLINIDIPIKSVGDYAFKDCLNLIQIDLSGVYAYISADQSQVSKIDIGDYAFYNCQKLSQVMHSKYDLIMVDTIGDHAFYNCIALSQLDLMPTESIGDYAFYNTFSLINITLYNTDYIGDYAFYSSAIMEANLGLTEVINHSSFENCKNLKSISITSGVIESRAFYNTGIEKVYIGTQVTSIAEDAFAYSPIKNNNGSTDGSGKYNAISGVGIVELSTNKLLVGFAGNTGYIKLSDTITEIGKYAYTGNYNLTKIAIPESVQTINDYAFKDCYQLSEVYFMGSTITLGNNVFSRSNEGDIKDSTLNLYVLKNSNLKNYAKNNNIEYRYIEPDEVVVTNNKTTYDAFEQVDVQTISVKLIYHEEIDRVEELSQIIPNQNLLFSNYTGYNIKYYTDPSRTNFIYGDEYYIVEAYNKLGYKTEKQVPVQVNKITPQYTIPTGLTAKIGQTLNDVTLPECFGWMDSSTKITSTGEKTYKAKYTPKDTNNYLTVENIDITVSVTQSKTIITPIITINNKIYDGTKQIDKTTINISNLTQNEYSILNAVTKTPDVGANKALVTLKLSDNKYENFAFSNFCQEMEFEVDIEIVKNTLDVITNNTKDYEGIFDNQEHTLTMVLGISNYTIKYSQDGITYNLDTIPKYKNPGEYTIYYKVTAQGYEELTSSNKVKIYGIKEVDSTIDQKNNTLVTSNNSFNTLTSKISIYAPSKTLTHLDSSKKVATVDQIKTGDILRITIGNTNIDYELAYLGDVNGNGEIDIIDYIRIMKDIMKTTKLSGIYYEAADMNRDGQISIIDYIRVIKIIMEEK